MIIDDDKTMVTMLNRALEHNGYRVITALHGRIALAAFQKAKPDLVLLDIMMPGINGMQVLNTIRQQSHVPVIMLSAAHDQDWLQQALIAGADDYLKKPFSIREMIARINAKIRRVNFTKEHTPKKDMVACSSAGKN